LPLKNKFVSSANNIGIVTEETLGKSFTYKRNRIGPRIDPWGTPQLIGRYLGRYSFYTILT
jgi:hypothetical protein